MSQRPACRVLGQPRSTPAFGEASEDADRGRKTPRAMLTQCLLSFFTKLYGHRVNIARARTSSRSVTIGPAGEGDQAWYLGEDYAFCERAAAAASASWPTPASVCGTSAPIASAGRTPDAPSHATTISPSKSPMPPRCPLAPVADSLRESERTRGASAPRARQHSGRLREPARNALHEATRPLPASFPRLRAYCVSYPANQHSLRLTLEDFRQCDWGEEPIVFMQPDDWPRGKPSASRNYRRVLEHAYEDGCDFALILEDDVRVNRRLRHNLTNLPLLRRDQCDYLSLFMPDLIVSPWQRARAAPWLSPGQAALCRTESVVGAPPHLGQSSLCPVAAIPPRRPGTLGPTERGARYARHGGLPRAAFAVVVQLSVLWWSTPR